MEIKRYKNTIRISVVKYKCVYFSLISAKCYLSLVQTQNLADILVSAEIPFVNLNLSRISTKTKISDLSKILAEIWLRLEIFHESGPRYFGLGVYF